MSMSERVEAIAHAFERGHDHTEAKAIAAAVVEARSLDAEIAALKAEIARYTGDLTDGQAHSVMASVVQQLGGSTCRRDANAFDAAIREVRGK